MRIPMWPAAAGLLAILGAPDLRAQAVEAEAELKRLEAAFQEAYDAWMQAYRAASEAGDDEKVQEILAKQPAPEFSAEFLKQRPAANTAPAPVDYSRRRSESSARRSRFRHRAILERRGAHQAP